MKGYKTVGDVLSSEIVIQSLQDTQIGNIGSLVGKNRENPEIKETRKIFISKLISLYKTSYQYDLEDYEIHMVLSALFYVFSQESIAVDMTLDEIPDSYRKVAEETKIAVKQLLGSDISQEYPYIKGIYKTLRRRFEITDAIGAYKKSLGEEIVNTQRWEQVNQNIETLSKGLGFDDSIIKSIYSPIHNISCERQEKVDSRKGALDLGVLRSEIDKLDQNLVQEIISYLERNQKNNVRSLEIIGKLIQSFRK